MRTIVFQSDARANNPVGGCYRIIQELQRQIEYSQAELDLVHQQLAICRAQTAQQQQQQQQQQHSNLTLACDIINPQDPLNSYNSNYYYIQEAQDDLFTMNNDDDDDNNQQQFQLHENYDHQCGLHESTTALSTLNIKQSFMKQCDNEVVHNDDDDDYGIPCERHTETKFQNEDIIERRFVPSTQLVMSS
ncbi:hypothetical protein V6N12_029662 [Hibiscus sabdariffa]|uniref:LOB domain-containing protein n=1 Tax=Hibiscus sabdariffa TaxID=183260 RepID=A0ABR2CWS3_9ROSI